MTPLEGGQGLVKVRGGWGRVVAEELDHLGPLPNLWRNPVGFPAVVGGECHPEPRSRLLLCLPEVEAPLPKVLPERPWGVGVAFYPPLVGTEAM